MWVCLSSILAMAILLTCQLCAQDDCINRADDVVVQLALEMCCNHFFGLKSTYRLVDYRPSPNLTPTSIMYSWDCQLNRSFRMLRPKIRIVSAMLFLRNEMIFQKKNKTITENDEPSGKAT